MTEDGIDFKYLIVTTTRKILIKMNYNKEQDNLLKEEVKQHFAGVKSVEEWNERRQELCDVWSERFTGTARMALGNKDAIIPEWVQKIARYVDTSGLIVELLGKNPILPNSKVGEVEKK
jgi:hypothetical protein